MATLALAGLLPVAVQAQNATDDWKFGATIYGWATTGSSSSPTGGGGFSIDLSTKQVIDALKFAFMGSLEGKNGQWGFWTDGVHAEFGASKSAVRDFSLGNVGLPVGVSADLGLDMKSDSPIQSLSMYGPTIGVAFRW